MKDVTIRTEGPIKIKSAEPKIWEWIKRLGGLLALIVTIIFIIDRFFLEPKISSKIVGYSAAHSSDLTIQTFNSKLKNLSGINYIVRFLINIQNDDLNYSDMEVLIRYENDNKEYIGRIYNPTIHQGWTVNEEPRELSIPHNELLYYKTVLEKHKTHLFYLTFIVLEDTTINYNGNTFDLEGNYKYPKTIQLKFISSKKPFYKKINKIYLSNKMAIKETSLDKYIFDDKIWIKKQ